MKSFSFRNNTVHYTLVGTGRPIVFLHGFLEDHKMWETILPDFKDNMNLCIDLPCHGNSSFSGDNCSMKLMAEIVNALLERLRIENPFVIGHSMGGYVGLELLKLRNIHLTLLHSNFWCDDEPKRVDRNRVIEVVENNHELFVREAIPGLFYAENMKKCNKDIENLILNAKKLNPQEIIASTAGMRDRTANHELINNNPVTIIQGENDPIISPDKMKIEMKKLKNKPKIYELKNVGHMSIWENKKALIHCMKKIIHYNLK